MNMKYLASMVVVALASSWPLTALAQGLEPQSIQIQIPDRSPSETFPELVEVEALGRAGKVKEEELKIGQLREANPNRKEPLIYIGLRLMNGSLEKARPWFEQAAIIDPDDPYAQANIARIDSVAGNIDAARARLNAADKKRPASLQLALARVDVELVAKNPAGMLSAIRQAQSLAVPKSELPFLYSRLADAHLMQNGWLDALDALDKLLAIEPILPRRFQRANVLVQLGRLEQALPEYQALQASELMRDPQFAKALGERLVYAKQAAAQVLTVTKANHSEYYALVPAEELARDFSATNTFNCRAGAFVIAYKEIRPKTNALGIEGMLVAPLRKVGAAGVAGEATLFTSQLDSLAAPSVFSISGISAADEKSLSGRRSLKFCPAE
jgi:tetratricopeptide (TPR) repeat protein